MTRSTTTSLAEDAWMTTAEVIAYTRRSKATIGRHVAAGTLESTSPGRGRGRRYRREWVDKWMQEFPRLPDSATSRTA
jgi:excisionase family DNA binding protein